MKQLTNQPTDLPAVLKRLGSKRPTPSRVKHIISRIGKYGKTKQENTQCKTSR